MTTIVPNMLASRHSTSQLMAPTCMRSIRAATKIIKACAKHVTMKAANITAGRRFEVSFIGDIEQTWLLSRNLLQRVWNRLSLIDGGGRLMKYEGDIYARFNEAVNDSNQNDLDPTLLFIATDGKMIYKAFAGPATAVDYNYYVSQGFDDETFMGVWSHEWIRDQISDMEDAENPDQEWANLMEGMVVTIAKYADGISPPGARNS